GFVGCRVNQQSAICNLQPSERGYTMMALLVVMTLLALFAVAAAPNVRQQSQREREKEAIFRGEQVAEAIRSYYRFRGAQGVNSLPTSMDQLLEGIPRGTKKLQILRTEAAHDPLSASGEWRLIGPTSPELAKLVESLTIYSGGTVPAVQAPFQNLQALIPRMTNILNTGSSDAAPGGDDTSASSDGPFLGVA